MKKVRIDLYGGLGNQMFGGALGLALVGQFPDLEIELLDRLIPMGSNPTRRLEIDDLGIFNHSRIKFKSSSRSLVSLMAQNYQLRRVWWRIQRLVMRRSLITQMDIGKEKLSRSGTPIFSDYFSDWFYIEFASKSFTIPTLPNLDSPNREAEEIVSLVSQDNVITIHCRLGDYLNHPEVYKILREDYFIEAIEMIESDGKFKFELVIFCESSKQLEQYYPHLAQRAKMIVDRTSSMSDINVFATLCRSRNLIAANSTFSIWAAWFVQRRKAKAIVPIVDKKSAICDGSIYLDWTLFDLSRHEFLNRREVEKDAWFGEKQRLFVRLEQLFR